MKSLSDVKSPNIRTQCNFEEYDKLITIKYTFTYV